MCKLTKLFSPATYTGQVENQETSETSEITENVLLPFFSSSDLQLTSTALLENLQDVTIIFFETSSFYLEPYTQEALWIC